MDALSLSWMFSAHLTSKPHGRPGCAARNGSWVQRATRTKYRKIPNKKEKEKGAYGGVKQNQMGTCGRSSQGTPSHLSLTALSLKRLRFSILSSTCNKNTTFLLYHCNSATQKCLLIIFFDKAEVNLTHSSKFPPVTHTELYSYHPAQCKLQLGLASQHGQSQQLLVATTDDTNSTVHPVTTCHFAFEADGFVPGGCGKGLVSSGAQPWDGGKHELG